MILREPAEQVEQLAFAPADTKHRQHKAQAIEVDAHARASRCARSFGAAAFNE